jgi:predicted DNA-binding ribbon-helix-helix protein
MSPSKHKKGGIVSSPGKAPVRASVSFPPDLYQLLEEIARRKKVSLAWVIREAAEKYAANERLLLKPAGKQGRHQKDDPISSSHPRA